MATQISQKWLILVTTLCFLTDLKTLTEATWYTEKPYPCNSSSSSSSSGGLFRRDTLKPSYLRFRLWFHGVYNVTYFIRKGYKTTRSNSPLLHGLGTVIFSSQFRVVRHKSKRRESQRLMN